MNQFSCLHDSFYETFFTGPFDDVIFRFHDPDARFLDPADPETLSVINRDNSENSFNYIIRMAVNQKQKKAAKDLVSTMYSFKNYPSDRLLQDESRLTTFLAYDSSKNLVGTVTMGIDDGEGLYAGEGYPEEVATLQKRGEKVCEFTCLAILPGIRSKKVLASLFHVAMLYAQKMFHCTSVVFEVTPGHGRVYERMLGMTQLAKGRICPRVNVSSVLIYANFSRVEKEIKKVHLLSPHGQPLESRDRSLYQYFFSPLETSEIVSRFYKLSKSGAPLAPEKPRSLPPFWESDLSPLTALK